ncbi:MAG TPA: tyrosine-type recombinase/integrase [Hyphomicrobiaceae bacterium]|nr:tyrosine-type recombinase/integrase [Hyphomicrobiaceae bacterium]
MPKPIRKKITLTVINSVTPNTFIWDTQLRGFGIRRQRSDAVTYILRTRIHGRQRFFVIGQHGMATPDGNTWTPDTARRQAVKVMGNPAIAEKPTKSKPDQQPGPLTFENVAVLFLAKHGPMLRPRTRVEYERLIRLYLNPAFGAKPLTAITRADVSTASLAWSDTPRSANFALTVLSKLMTWSKDEGLREGDNPVTRVKRYKEVRRERYLSLDEVSRIGAALADCERDGSINPHGTAAIRLLILTGARLSEILTLQWSFINLDRGLLFLPDSKTGQKTITLNDAAIAVLREVPRLAGNPYVIVGKIHATHLANLHYAWDTLCERANITGGRRQSR